MQKYSEEVIRHPAVNEEGKPCEILERVTFERQPGQDAGQRVVVNRRYDLRTGERLIRLDDNEFQEDESGAKVRLHRD